MTEIKMPRLSDSMQEGTILSWLKSDGDEVATGEELLEIETDKATVAYESPGQGVLTIVAAVGETLPVGALIARLGEGVQSVAPAPRAPGLAPVAESAASDGDGSVPDRVRATPVARRLAREHGVDLADLRGTGPGGRITKTDVVGGAAIEPDREPALAPDRVPARAPAGEPALAPASVPGRAPAGEPALAPASEPSPPPQAALTESPPRAENETVQLTRTQQVIARRMSESKATIPHFQVQTEAEMGPLVALRAQLKALGDQAEPVPSLNDFIVKACAIALGAHPRANGSYKDGGFELHRRINIGIAVAAPDSLVVPTITDADQRTVRSIAAESRRLAERVREGTVTPPELSGATFTVSNLGMYGMTAITPVINPPQAAILGVGALRAVATLVDGELVERHLMTLTLSCDHRILYGADAAVFLADIRDAVQQPLRLML
jgi:pyruvate dehydrogenase E2 component (dihydrolipoamide acetyltransferase)